MVFAPAVSIKIKRNTKKLHDANQRMLIRQLRELEDDKVITRFVYPVVPPKVEYELSEIGRLLEPVVTSICDWGDNFSDFLEKGANKT